MNMTVKDVVIVGAGPVGMTLALILAKFGVDFVIVDKTDAWPDKSKAMTITPRTLEQLNLIGVADDLVKKGIPSDFINYYYRTHFISKADFRSLNTKYNFILQIPQATTVEVLHEHCVRAGIDMRQNCEFVSFERKVDCVVGKFKRPSGELFEIESRYLVACDGGRSTVRAADGISFDGGEYEETFLMADVVMENFPFDFNERHLFYLPKRSFFYAMPIATEGKKNIYRIITTMKSGSTLEEDVVLKRFQEIMSSIGIDDVVLSEPRWISQFNPRQFVVSDFYHDKIVYAGDAAHIQSPIGSQGLNTGIQDAFNLAWRLALQVQRKTTQNLLHDYHRERKAIALNLFNYNDKISRVIFGYNRFYRLFFIALKWLNRFASFNRKEIEAVSQLRIGYAQENDLAGSRMLNFALADKRSIYDVLSAHKFSLFYFLTDASKSDEVEQVRRIVSTYSEMVECFFIHTAKTQVPSGNQNYLLVTQFPSQVPAICLVRPDAYIAKTYEQEDFTKKFVSDFAALIK